MIYLIVRRYKTEYSEDYRIEKHTRDLEQANKFLSALTLLEDNENSMYFIVPAKEILDKSWKDEVA